MRNVSMVIALLSVLVSCVSTVDVEQQKLREIWARNEAVEQGEAVRHVSEEELAKVAEEVEEVEEAEEAEEPEAPVVVQQPEPQKEIVVVQDPVIIWRDRDEYGPRDREHVVGEAMRGAVVEPRQYVGGTHIYYYNANKQYPIVAKTLGFSIIQLEPGEEVTGQPVLSDTERWIVVGEIWDRDEGDTQLIMVKPLEPGLVTNMLVVTKRRLYQFLLTSSDESYMPMVRFHYPEEMRFVTHAVKQEEERRVERQQEAPQSEFVSHNYVIKHPWFGWFKPEWTPIDVYDDGSKTYIVMPRMVLQKEYPTVFEENNHIVNYRVRENVIEIDKLITKITMKLGNNKVMIEKKDGQPLRLEEYERGPVQIVRPQQTYDGPDNWQRQNPRSAQFSDEERNAVAQMSEDAQTTPPQPGGDGLGRQPYQYTIRLLSGQHPAWMPEAVYEKNGNTIIVFPQGTIATSEPYIIDENNREILSAKMNDELIIDDQQFTTLRMAANGSVVLIERKGETDGR